MWKNRKTKLPKIVASDNNANIPTRNFFDLLTDSEKFFCDFCGYQANSNEPLEDHVKAEHGIKSLVTSDSSSFNPSNNTLIASTIASTNSLNTSTSVSSSTPTTSTPGTSVSSTPTIYTSVSSNTRATSTTVSNNKRTTSTTKQTTSKRILPEKVASFEHFNSLREKLLEIGHACADCSSGGLYNYNSEKVCYPSSGPFSYLCENYIMFCPNNPNAKLDFYEFID